MPEGNTRLDSPDADQTLVTIIMFCDNVGQYFEETFNSIMNQTFPWFEWIIIDDGITNQENTDVLMDYAKKDKRIRIVSESVQGLSYETCWTFTNTDFVILLKEGDLIAPQSLEYLYWPLYYNSNASMVYTDSVAVRENACVSNNKFVIGKNGLPRAAMIRRQAYAKESRKAIHIPMEMVKYRDVANGDSKDIRIEEIKFIDRYEEHSFYRPKYIKWEAHSDQKGDEKRILWLIPQMVMGGADKFNLDAITGLAKLSYKSYVLTTVHANHVWRQRFEEYTDEVYCMAEFLNPVYFMEYVSYILQSRQIDILMVTNSYAGYYMLPWIREHFPQLVIIDYVHLEEWYWRAGGYARTSAATHSITEKTYVCNSSTRKVLIDNFGCDPQMVDCMYIGVDHQYFDKERENEGYLHERLGIEQERPIVLFPCRINEQKRPFMLIHIAQGVIKKVPEAAFVVVGDGPQLSELKQVIKKKGLQKYIYCNGASDRMRACYRDAKAVLICSINEGLALTAYEACSMSVPVVSSDVGGQKDLVGDDVGALIPMQQAATDIDNRNFSQEEITLYVNKLVQILSDAEYAEKLGNTARRKIETGFSIKLMVKQLDQELQMLCTDKVREQKRGQLSDALRMMPHIATDYYTMYLEWEKGLRNHGVMSLLYILYDALLKIPIVNIPVRAVGKIVYGKILK